MTIRQALTVALFVAGVAVHPAHADDSWRVNTDTLLYTDTDNVFIVSPQLAVRRTIDEDGGAVEARVVVDAISAASVDVVSQATSRFSEVRTEVDLSISKAIAELIPALSYRRSQEPDYISNGGRAGLTVPLGGDDTTLSGGYGYTYDIVKRSGTPASVFSENLSTHSVDVSVTQVLSPKALVRVAYTLTGQSGYLEKPYRHVPLFTEAGLAAAAADGIELNLDTFADYALPGRPMEEVPDKRLRHALALRAMYFVPSWTMALKLDYQLYFDSWGVLSNMVEGSVEKYLASKLTARVFGRLYQQGAADFWQKTYVVSGAGTVPRWRTADRALTSYQTLAAGLRIQWQPGDWSFYVDGAAYDTTFSDYLYLDQRLALVAQTGARVQW